MLTVPVYEWISRGGEWIGQGTAVEFDYWQDQGVVPKGAVLAKVIGHEPASEDARRRDAWLSE